MDSIQQVFRCTKPKWEWNKISSSFSTKVQDRLQCISLKPSIAINKDGENDENLNILMALDVQKSLQFDGTFGWNWHKSSNLPVISLKIQLQDPQKPDILYYLPQNLQARIFSVKILTNTLEKETLYRIQDVGLRGVDRIKIKQGMGIFDKIRFKTTSYINQGVKFHFLIILYLRDSQPNSQFRNIICSVISPSIFVDSRKSARDHFEKRFASFVHPFNPMIMQRQYLKKSFKDKTKQYQIKVQNNIDGLYNYLTAPNIRHKVKHPLFLCVKFSNVFKILFNTNYKDSKVSTPFKLQNIILDLQNILINQIDRNKNCQKGSSFQTDKSFIINIVGQCQNLKKAKIYQCLDFINCNSIVIIKNSYQIAPHYKNIFQAGNVADVYTEIYDLIRQKSRKDAQNSSLSNEQEDQQEQRDNSQDSFETQKNEQKLNQSQPKLAYPKNNLLYRNASQNRTRAAIQPLQSYVNTTMINSQLYLESILNQIDLQNKILQGIIGQNLMLKQRITSQYLGLPLGLPIVDLLNLNELALFQNNITSQNNFHKQLYQKSRINQYNHNYFLHNLQNNGILQTQSKLQQYNLNRRSYEKINQGGNVCKIKDLNKKIIDKECIKLQEEQNKDHYL